MLVMPGLASRYSLAPIGLSTATAFTGSPDLTASEAGRSPMLPTSIRRAAKPESTSGPLSNSTKFTWYLAPFSAPDAFSSVCRFCCWSPTFSTEPGDVVPSDVCVARVLDAHALASTVTTAARQASAPTRRPRGRGGGIGICS